jgi:uncharacterized delta-60 repeat protein
MRLFSRNRTTPRTRTRRPFRPRLDALEDRFLLTAGALDTTFGNGGVVLTSFPPVSKQFHGTAGSAFAVAIQSDGKIVAAGWGLHDFALARYNTNGTLDSTFGSGGKVETDFGQKAEDDAYDLAIQPDGKIVVLGTTVVTMGGVSQSVYALARYNPNGTLDTTFGPNKNGLLVTTIDSAGISAMGIAIQPDGKIDLAVTSKSPGSTNTQAVLVRYDSDGSLDTSFGQSGILTPTFVPGASQKLFDLALETVGGTTEIVVTGAVTSPSDVAVARFNLDGSPDTSFGSGGSVVLGTQVTDFGGGRLAIQADGKILLVGSTPTHQGAVARFDINGTLDSTFNPNGPTPGIDVIAGTGGGGFWNGVVQSDGKIVAAGGINSGTGNQMLLTRLNADGSLDSTFGTNGVVLETLIGNAYARDVALQSDGKIVTAGDAYSVGDFAVARFLGDPPPAARAANAAPASNPTLVPLVPNDPGFLDTTASGQRRQRGSSSS